MTRSEHSLGQLPVGARGVIERVGCPRPVARRLMEMGLLPGTPVQVVRVAPLGDPIELRVRGYALSLQRRDAAEVTLVEVQTRSELPSGVREGVT
ncbi:MAG: FeoA family protein [Myxococcota bacterium]